jgi:hypothetical protein
MVPMCGSISGGVWFQGEVANREKEKGSEAAEFLNPRKEEKKRAEDKDAD